MRMKVYIFPNCNRNVYLGHRRFLPTNHPLRKKGKHFKGEADHRKKPVRRTGDDILDMVKDLPEQVIFGKGPGGNLFRMTLTDTHPCGRRNLYFGTYTIGKT